MSAEELADLIDAANEAREGGNAKIAVPNVMTAHTRLTSARALGGVEITDPVDDDGKPNRDRYTEKMTLRFPPVPRTDDKTGQPSKRGTLTLTTAKQ